MPLFSLVTGAKRSFGFKSLEVNMCNLNRRQHESGDLPLHIGFQVLNPEYDMDAYMATLFGGEAWDMC